MIGKNRHIFHHSVHYCDRLWWTIAKLLHDTIHFQYEWLSMGVTEEWTELNFTRWAAVYRKSISKFRTLMYCFFLVLWKYHSYVKGVYNVLRALNMCVFAQWFGVLVSDANAKSVHLLLVRQYLSNTSWLVTQTSSLMNDSALTAINPTLNLWSTVMLWGAVSSWPAAPPIHAIPFSSPPSFHSSCLRSYEL